MKQTEKPRYTVRQNVRCMLRLAWKREKSVIWLCLGFAALSLGINLAQLYIAPEVLQRVEQKAPLGELLGVIAAFSLALVLLSGLLEYVNLNSGFVSAHPLSTTSTTKPARPPTPTPATRTSSS